jgi:hypothetical protein
MGTTDIQVVMVPQALQAVTDSTELVSLTTVACIDVAAMASSVDTEEKVPMESLSPIKTNVKVAVAALTAVEDAVARDFTELSSPVASTDIIVAAY